MMNISSGELNALLRLHCLPHISTQRITRLLSTFGNAASALSAPASAWSSLKMPAESIALRHSGQIGEQVDAILRWLEHPQHAALSITQDQYPALLKEISDAPPLLFVQGNLDALHIPQLAIVGSRNASALGISHAAQFAQCFAKAGGVITSGLARGVDTAAHQGALKVGGKTVAVMGTGMLHTYPKANSKLRAQIIEQAGAIVSELALEVAPLAHNFPRRNRIISGLSLGVLVTEASIRSGSLITARLAIEQGREVFAIPGSIHHAGAKGCHQLLREGAVLTESIEDILQNLQHWQQRLMIENSSGQDQCAQAQHPLITALQACPLTLDDLSAVTQLPINDVLAQLTDLEISGYVHQENGLWLYRPNTLE
ncbi:DNA-processing protein DprA [Pseudomonas sp. F1_0610]|uniref:DNA-processing protein DprA n=1 Tax=Pseudomonas sp. F1_0610 TaxID=3114284 RepID=UPI0039C15658